VVNKKAINYEAEASVFRLNLIFPTDIKRDQTGKLFYYVPRWGESGRWYEFGIPESKQVI
jgi:hypothetical protein